MTNIEQKLRSILELISTSGETVSCAGNSPVRLNDPNYFWIVERGSVNVFLVELIKGVEQSKRQHLICRREGQMLPAVALNSDAGESDKSQFNVIAKGLPGTQLKRVPIALLGEVEPAELAPQINSWIAEITDALSRFVPQPPRPTALVKPVAGIVDLKPCILSAQQDIVWISSRPPKTSLFMDVVDETECMLPATQESSWTPLTRSSWLSIFNAVSVECQSTESMIRQGLLPGALNVFNHLVLEMKRINRGLALVDEANLERARTSSRRTVQKKARQELFNLYNLKDGSYESDTSKNLINALFSVGQFEGLTFKIPKRTGPSQPALKLSDILDSSGVRCRQVFLKKEDKWWRMDAGALLAFKKDDEQPIALLPRLFGGYRIVDPQRQQTKFLTQKRAEKIAHKAWMFYPQLPPKGALPSDILRVALKGSSGAIMRLVSAGILKGLVVLASALALGFMIHHLATGGSTTGLYVLFASLSLVGLIAALLNISQDRALYRLSTRALARLEATFWDRILRVPQNRLPNHSVGDLAMSSMIFQQMRSGAEGIIAHSVLLTLFLIPPLAFTLFYDFALGLTAFSFSFVALGIAIFLGYRQISPQIRFMTASRSVTGRLFQIINGIAKLRVELAEGSAYAVWAEEYRNQKLAEIDLGQRKSHSQAFATSLPFFAAGTLFLVIAADSRSQSIHQLVDFMIVFVLFLTFQSALSRFSISCGELAASLPAFRQLNPVIKAEPEIEEQGEPIDFLGGHLLFDKVSFRYDADGPLILDDVTIEACPGEFVAIAGESGAGKSTLFRLALGLDRPLVGAVLYDGRDLQNLNLKQVRRMIGAVPQAIRLHPQDIWDNVVMHQVGISYDEVWEATRLAGIEKQLKAMPMGFMTAVGTSGLMLSGGESQRISLARALLGNPRIVLLDEATNWLDNVGQAEFMENLSMLMATRVVIAHRLSTLEKADRIYVLEGGRVAQIGNYHELASTEGLFKKLIQRQVV